MGVLLKWALKWARSFQSQIQASAQRVFHTDRGVYFDQPFKVNTKHTSSGVSASQRQVEVSWIWGIYKFVYKFNSEKYRRILNRDRNRKKIDTSVKGGKVKKIPIAFSFSHILLPFICFSLFVFGAVGLDSNRSFLEHYFSLFGVVSFLLVILFNWFFSMYSFLFFWRKMSVWKRLKFFVITVLANGLSGYVYFHLWESEGVKVMSMENKSFSDAISLLFFFLFMISLIVPFIAADAYFSQ